MTTAPLDFLNDHSLNFLEMALRTDRSERVENPDGYGKRTGDCGDTIEIFISCPTNVIESVSFWVDGCVNTTACCNTVAQMAEGKTVDQAWQITPEAVSDFLETLPTHEAHCAQLAVGAFYLALSDLKRI